MAHNYGTTECCECHREFRRHAGNHTCCPDCQHERRTRQIPESWHKKKAAKGHAVRSNGELQPIECPVCHSPFLPKNGKKYCSEKCMKKAKYAREVERRGYTQTGKQAPEYRQRAGMTRFSRKCHRCGRPTNDFEYPDSQQYRRAQGY